MLLPGPGRPRPSVLDGFDHRDPTRPAGRERSAAAASEVVAAGEAAWAAIRAAHPEVPPAVVVLGSGVERGRLVKLGHWWGSQWRAGAEARGEVLLAGEALHLAPEAVFEVLLHEATHGLCAARGAKDTSRDGRYHNRRFRAAATEVGLVVGRVDPHGWARTRLGPEARVRYAEAIAGLGRTMRLARALPGRPGTGAGVEAGGGGAGSEAGEGRRPPKGPAAECGCGRKLRMARAAFEQGPVTCGVCGEDFTHPRRAERALGVGRPAGPEAAPAAGRTRAPGVDLRTVGLPVTGEERPDAPERPPTPELGW